MERVVSPLKISVRSLMAASRALDDRNACSSKVAAVADKQFGYAGKDPSAAFRGWDWHINSPVKPIHSVPGEAINLIDLSQIASRRRKEKSQGNAQDCVLADVVNKNNADTDAKDRNKSQQLQLISTLRDIFPKVSEELVSFCFSILADEWSFERKLQFSTDILLGYLPSTHQAATAGTSNDVGGSASSSIMQDLSNPPQEPRNSVVDVRHHHWCLHKLSLHFPRAPMKIVRLALTAHGGNLGATYRSLHYYYFKALAKEGGYSDGKEELCHGKALPHWVLKGGLKLMVKPRSNSIDAPVSPSIDLEKEWEAIQVQFSDGFVGQNDYFLHSFEENRKPEEPRIECGCCCSDYLFEEMIQCADGHLFCFDCVRRRLEESIFGTSQASARVQCMDTDGCEESFPWTELQRCIPQDVLSKYEQRQAEDAISRAKLEGLVYCPFCQFPCEVDRDIFILKCPSHLCRKDSCIRCKEPSHWPLKCEEVVKDSETSLRKSVEEEMTKALLRECSTCKASLVKVDGCNKVTCRCGQSMCYVCRKPIRDYHHFCQHARQPAAACKECNRCFLWEQEESSKVVRAAREFAMEEAAKKQPDFVKRRVGPSDEISAKRRKSDKSL
ncbi:hypothetical protein O6H91_14G007100 [Diphasiastrum complanatum]|uniref:Uncharacterized protein n=1 Tax=Diphasiastrum complanatum TaxID=34168 RepID=A0ACC2BL82_DIPCM|nr:hypothetical protein O6H91_14G007100 [Diphasiastrum complanatum]